MSDLLLLGYAGAVGFVAAGIAASFYKMLTAEPARFRLFGESVIAYASGLLFVAVTGPVILVTAALERMRKAELSPAGVLGGVVVAAFWSCCLGIVVLEIALAIRDSLSA